MTDDLQLWVVCLHLHPGDADLRAHEGDLLRARLEGLLGSCGHTKENPCTGTWRISA